jgi:hypothetical protein
MRGWRTAATDNGRLRHLVVRSTLSLFHQQPTAPIVADRTSTELSGRSKAHEGTYKRGLSPFSRREQSGNARTLTAGKTGTVPFATVFATVQAIGLALVLALIINRSPFDWEE